MTARFTSLAVFLCSVALLCAPTAAFQNQLVPSFRPTATATSSRGDYSSSSSSTRLAYTAAVDVPYVDENSASFEERMRKLVLTNKSSGTASQQRPSSSRRRTAGVSPSTASTTRTAPSIPSVIREVNTLQEFSEAVADKERLTVVRFYATYCRACKLASPPFYRLVNQLEQSGQSINWVQVPVTKDNASLIQGLGVPSIPYGHIYHPTAGLVEELKFNKKNLKTAESVLKTYLDGECEVFYTEDYEEGQS